MKKIEYTENGNAKYFNEFEKTNCQNLGELCKAILDGEPVFIIRAQDDAALDGVQGYLDVCELSIEDRVRSAMKEIKEWQEQNKDKVKKAD